MMGFLQRVNHRAFRKEEEMIRIRNIKYGDTYHPFRAIGRWIFLFCLLFMAFAAITGIIPGGLQSFAAILLSVIMILSGVLALWGSVKSFDRSAYPFFLAVIVIAFVVMTVWALGLSP
jgi:hypothetical protein